MNFCPKCGDEILENEVFCNKCGHKLIRTDNNVQLENNHVYYNDKYDLFNNYHKLIIGILIGFGVILIVVGIVTVFGDNRYYFSDDSYGNGNDNVVNIENNNKSSKGKYSTVIVTDNFYEGVKISNESDVVELIEKDSVQQKTNCPNEIKAIEDNIIKKYNIYAVNLCELDLDFANEIANVLDVIYNEYPSARGYLSNLSLINAPVMDSYIAAFLCSQIFASSNTELGYPYGAKTQIFLNTNYFLNKERLAQSTKEASAVGHFPPNANIYSPVAHEMGHYLSFLTVYKNSGLDSNYFISFDYADEYYKLLETWSTYKPSYDLVNTAYNNYIKDTGDSIAFDDWRGTISAYALQKNNDGKILYDETVAEGFHDVYLNKNNAKPASQYIVKELKRRLEG